MRKSIISNTKQCYICGKKDNLHYHHIIFGKNRQKCDEDGLMVYLCYYHHKGTNGVHGKNGHNLDMMLKRIAEEHWLLYYQKEKEDFIKRYGRNYLP